MKRFSLGVVLITLLSVVAACAPEPLEGFGDVGMTGNNTTGNNTTDTGTSGNNTSGGNNVTFTTQFQEVGDIFFGNAEGSPGCAVNGCHGAQPGPEADWVVPSQDLATLQESFDIMIEEPTGYPLISPGDPASSEIYVRLTAAEGTTIMPTTGALPDAMITTVETWIADGANYTE